MARVAQTAAHIGALAGARRGQEPQLRLWRTQVSVDGLHVTIWCTAPLLQNRGEMTYAMVVTNSHRQPSPIGTTTQSNASAMENYVKIDIWCNFQNVG